jgi:hypothetical protein
MTERKDALSVEDLEIKVRSDLDYEELIAEIYIDGEFFGLISEEAGPRLFELEIHPRKDGKPWRLKLAEVERAIEEAVGRLVRMPKRETREEPS